ncbi:MAG: hypothetical protein AAGJ93_12805 [Bacteroidota bacterium]
MNELLKVQPTDTKEQLCQRLSAYLGLNKPVPEAVLLRTLAEPIFAKRLLAARNNLRLLLPLLNDDINERFKLKSSNLELIRKATAAFIKWGKSGFTIVDQDTLRRRETACLDCPHTGLSERFLQKMVARQKVTGVPGKRLGASICKLCNCVLDKKIKLSTESCPDAHPELKGQTRWGEAIKRRKGWI